MKWLLAFLFCVAFSAPALSATIVTAVEGCPCGPGQLGTIPATLLFKANTYDFTFAIDGGGGEVLTQLQASVFGPVDEPIQFSLWSGLPGAGTFIAESLIEPGADLTDLLKNGSYFLQVDDIAANGELVSGSLDVAVPEPASWALIILGAGFVGGMSRRYRLAQT